MDTGDRAVNWQDEALCAEVGLDLFFPNSSNEGIAAKKICAECPVVMACLEAALAFPQIDDHGIRGGLSASERRRLRRAAA